MSFMRSEDGVENQIEIEDKMQFKAFVNSVV